jgi:hypothetical protein
MMSALACVLVCAPLFSDSETSPDLEVSMPITSPIESLAEPNRLRCVKSERFSNEGSCLKNTEMEVGMGAAIASFLGSNLT